jgi:hypothetical protein
MCYFFITDRRVETTPLLHARSLHTITQAQENRLDVKSTQLNTHAQELTATMLDRHFIIRLNHCNPSSQGYDYPGLVVSNLIK